MSETPENNETELAVSDDAAAVAAGEPAASADEVGRGEARAGGEAAGRDREARAEAGDAPADAPERRGRPAQPQRGPRTPEERDAERRERRARLAAQRRRYRAKRKAKLAAVKAAAPAREPDHAPEHGPGRPKVRQGVVVSDKADKTIVVRIDLTRRHRRYRKILRSSTTLHAHDERNDAHAGDTVRVVESRPLSATKRWRLVDVLERAR